MMQGLTRLAIAGALAFGAGSAAAQTGGEALPGKTVTMVIGFGPGGGYDQWGRAVARHIGKHLPGNPTVVPQNMPGAGSLLAANHIYNAAPKDGTVMGIIARDAALAELTDMKGARFEATKFSWLGSPATETNVCIAFHTAKVKTAKDLFQHELIIGNTGPGTGTYTYPKALNGLVGTKFRLVSGFPSSSDVFLAMERGEVEGICESLDSAVNKRPEWVAEKKINILFQGGAEPNPQIKEVPFVLDFAKTDEQRQAIRFLYAGQGIGRPFVAPPDLPPERLKMLRDAFNATMKDPDFIADVKKQKLDLEPQTGEQLEKLIKDIYATPKPVIERVSELVK
ncbi:MAG: tripartite tricarboxylate transporter substrate-binding protein [Pseudomonadota bacterium]|nr:tripartite tricarboxylate transporter substrate-binding protein [Pseudomonadota bacterium]